MKSGTVAALFIAAWPLAHAQQQQQEDIIEVTLTELGIGCVQRNDRILQNWDQCLLRCNPNNATEMELNCQQSTCDPTKTGEDGGYTSFGADLGKLADYLDALTAALDQVPEVLQECMPEEPGTGQDNEEQVISTTDLRLILNRVVLRDNAFGVITDEDGNVPQPITEEDGDGAADEDTEGDQEAETDQGAEGDQQQPLLREENARGLSFEPFVGLENLRSMDLSGVFPACLDVRFQNYRFASTDDDDEEETEGAGPFAFTELAWDASFDFGSSDSGIGGNYGPLFVLDPSETVAASDPTTSSLCVCHPALEATNDGNCACPGEWTIANEAFTTLLPGDDSYCICAAEGASKARSEEDDTVAICVCAAENSEAYDPTSGSCVTECPEGTEAVAVEGDGGRRCQTVVNDGDGDPNDEDNGDDPANPPADDEEDPLDNPACTSERALDTVITAYSSTLRGGASVTVQTRIGGTVYAVDVNDGRLGLSVPGFVVDADQSTGTDGQCDEIGDGEQQDCFQTIVFTNSAADDTEGLNDVDVVPQPSPPVDGALTPLQLRCRTSAEAEGCAECDEGTVDAEPAAPTLQLPDDTTVVTQSPILALESPDIRADDVADTRFTITTAFMAEEEIVDGNDDDTDVREYTYTIIDDATRAYVEGEVVFHVLRVDPVGNNVIDGPNFVQVKEVRERNSGVVIGSDALVCTPAVCTGAEDESACPCTIRRDPEQQNGGIDLIFGIVPGPAPLENVPSAEAYGTLTPLEVSVELVIGV
eukprot:Clim_evm1s187 gene=Clim_evmTU1s187